MFQEHSGRVSAYVAKGPGINSGPAMAFIYTLLICCNYNIDVTSKLKHKGKEGEEVGCSKLR